MLPPRLRSDCPSTARRRPRPRRNSTCRQLQDAVLLNEVHHAQVLIFGVLQDQKVSCDALLLLQTPRSCPLSCRAPCASMGSIMYKTSKRSMQDLSRGIPRCLM